MPELVKHTPRWQWIALILIIVAFGTYLWWNKIGKGASNSTGSASTTATMVSDGTITLFRPGDFGLAVTKERVLVRTYTPPCEEGFDYCLYYNGSAYKNTNFESAGLSIRRRTDLADKARCLSAQPSGYSGVPIRILDKPNYSVSVAQTGEGAAGHYATGEEFRLFTARKCYQFDTQVGESQFANYPAGSIEEFSKDSRTGMLLVLRNLVQSVKLNATGESLTLPQ